MLTLKIPERECWDEKKEEFIITKEKTIVLEHSLVSLSKWESKWKKPFLTNDSKSNEEILDYIKCMTITQNVKDETYSALTEQNMNDINNYIKDTMTATTFHEYGNDKKSDNEIKTAEILYYYMITFNIPIEFQKWHLNRLLTLIKVCNIKLNPGKKMSRREILERNTTLNEARKKMLKTKG